MPWRLLIEIKCDTATLEYWSYNQQGLEASASIFSLTINPSFSSWVQTPFALHVKSPVDYAENKSVSYCRGDSLWWNLKAASWTWEWCWSGMKRRADVLWLSMSILGPIQDLPFLKSASGDLDILSALLNSNDNQTFSTLKIFVCPYTLDLSHFPSLSVETWCLKGDPTTRYFQVEETSQFHNLSSKTSVSGPRWPMLEPSCKQQSPALLEDVNL